MVVRKPDYIYLESGAAAHPLAECIRKELAQSRIFEIRDHRKLDQETLPLTGYHARIKRQVLALASHPGPFVRPFPGVSDDPEDAREFFIAHANGCPFDCQYCYLQGYFQHGPPVLFVNREALLAELEAHMGQQTARGRTVTYHAGELSDALALERWSGFAYHAIEVFRRCPLARLELRTKCADVSSLLPENPPENVTVSWTLAPESAWQAYERGTPSPRQRLRSARACQARGYRVGIRFDPALIYPGWEADYAGLIDQIFDQLLPEKMETFVLGGFRHTPHLGHRIRERFPESTILLNEFVLCSDGKFRYFRPLRVALYRHLTRQIRGHSSTVPVELCMETGQIHRDVFGIEDPEAGGKMATARE